ncbi:hypothetical protein GU926_05410 [Nibribacter ruber]|uniref:Uncharacterized protein n=1 Tax=Nibribacter ruber TaxID=2698458 RepID=A0A6P1NX56_9BACT|nr:hypothetical protein [Nibribacter ruber]QHL86904.1 hypothetical protein GU926_05410 [Nibribacter ruber]
MRPSYRHIILLLLAFSVLTGSVGIAATQRFCAMMGMELPAAKAEKMKEMDCCKKKAQPKKSCQEAAAQVDKKECCSSSTTYHKLDNLALKLSDKVVFYALQPALVSSFLTPPTTAVIISSSWPSFTDTSPPLTGRDLLTRLHILNI